jgi:hypothetical protein
MLLFRGILATHQKIFEFQMEQAKITDVLQPRKHESSISKKEKLTVLVSYEGNIREVISLYSKAGM